MTRWVMLADLERCVGCQTCTAACKHTNATSPAVQWRKVLDIDFLVEQGTVDPEDRELFWFAETAEEIWHGILHWCEAAGRPLLPNIAEPRT